MRKSELVGWQKKDEVPSDGKREREIYFIPGDEEK